MDIQSEPVAEVQSLAVGDLFRYNMEVTVDAERVTKCGRLFQTQAAAHWKAGRHSLATPSVGRGICLVHNLR